MAIITVANTPRRSANRPSGSGRALPGAMNLFRKLCSIVAVSGSLVAASAPLAHASSFTVNFCPGGGGCPANVSEARLTFTENLGTADLNDYTVDLKIVGGAGDPKFIDQVSLTINTADNVTGA